MPTLLISLKLTLISGLLNLIPSPGYFLFKLSNKLFMCNTNFDVGSLSSNSSTSLSLYKLSPTLTDLLKT